MKSTCCAIAAGLLTSSVLTGCAHASRDAAVSRTLYQPPVLRLAPPVSVETQDGTYRPQVPEIWHSDERFRALEHQLLDAAAALEAARSTPTR